jgi:signal transduction histidine kinase
MNAATRTRRRSAARPIEIEAAPAAAAHLTHAVAPAAPDELRELMRSVNETAERLSATHIALREQVARLQGELAEANAQLRRSRSLAALGEMAAGIAHEVRNPLGSIQLYAQALAEDLVAAGRPEQAALCAKIDRAVTGLDAIVRDVLQFARDMSIAPCDVAADELFTRALEACEAPIAAAGVQVRREAGQCCRLRADAVLMTQALANVIRNAIEAMALIEGPRVLRLAAAECVVRAPGGHRSPHAVFVIEDTGGGIPPEVLGRIFNPFFTTRRTGTGLGLAIVHRIVDAHGGHINVRPRSGADCAGTRFELCLPIEK